MKKTVYTAPVTEITKWEAQDIITTSGEQLTALTDITSEIGDTNVTASVLFNDLQ